MTEPVNAATRGSSATTGLGFSGATSGAKETAFFCSDLEAGRVFRGEEALRKPDFRPPIPCFDDVPVLAG